MAFNILGLNHKTAPVALREKVAFSEDRLAAALADCDRIARDAERLAGVPFETGRVVLWHELQFLELRGSG